MDTKLSASSPAKQVVSFCLAQDFYPALREIFFEAMQISLRDYVLGV